MINIEMLCPGCFSPEFGGTHCDHCGYDKTVVVDEDFLKPMTVLENRYVVGVPIKTNAEHTVYIGFDQDYDKKVWIKEFFPVNVSERSRDGRSVNIKAGAEMNYKSLLSEFAEIYEKLQHIDFPGIASPVDLFTANGTVYAVTEYFRNISFSEVLKRSSGVLSWSQCKKIFMPLLNAISLMHKKSLAYRALSPETIVMNTKGVLWISDFSTTDMRSEEGCIDCELFDGFSAPEQYSPVSWQGAWTDVYSAAAVLYLALTGKEPPAARERASRGRLFPAVDINPMIPQNVSDALSDGLEYNSQDRIQSIDEFIARLIDTPASNTAVYVAKSKPPVTAERTREKQNETKDRKGREQLRARKQSKFRGLKYIIFTSVFSLLLLGGAAIFLMEDWMNSADFFTASKATTATTSPVSDLIPDFRGKTYEEITANTDNTIKFSFSRIDAPNSNYEKGKVFSQEPEQGSEIVGRPQITLYVSLGSEIVTVPNLRGKTVEEAEALLKEAGLQHETIEVINATWLPDVVTKQTPEPDSQINKNTEKVTIFIRNTHFTSASETSAPETQAAAE